MAEPYRLVVFDWDGTLLDSAAAIVHAIQAASRDLGLAEPSDEQARHVIGLGLSEALAHAVPSLAPADYPKMVERYRHHYLLSDHELTLFAGTEAMIYRLAERGVRLGIATGKSRNGLNRALAHTGLAGHFAVTRCADECPSKPHPQMLLEIIEELDVDPAHTLMVGDTTHDLQMAANAGVDALAVSFGAHPRSALLACGPVSCIDEPQELARWLMDHA